MQKQITVKNCPTKKGNRLTSFFVRFAEVSQTFFFYKKKVKDRESPRRKKKTHVIETRKDEVQKRDNWWTNVWAKMT